MGQNEVLRYIGQVALETPEDESMLLGEEADLPRLEDATRQGAVVDSNIVTFPEGTPVEVKDAVGSWLLLAQRAASAKVPDKDDTQGWMGAYHQALMDTGWARRGDAQAWVEEHVEGSTVHEKILAVAAVVLGPVPTALAIVTATLQSLQKMNEDSPWITLFDRRGRSATSVGFQVASCVPSDAGGAALHAIDFRVEARQVLTQVLFFRFTSREATMLRRGVVLELTPGALKEYGPAVHARVSAATLDSIAAIELADPS